MYDKLFWAVTHPPVPGMTHTVHIFESWKDAEDFQDRFAERHPDIESVCQGATVMFKKGE